MQGGWYTTQKIADLVGKSPQSVRLYLRSKYTRGVDGSLIERECLIVTSRQKQALEQDGSPWWRLTKDQFDDAVAALTSKGRVRRKRGRRAS